MIRKPTPKNKVQTAVVEEGVSITPMPVTEGEAVSINYDGLLAQSGASKLFTHVGYGSSENWIQVQDIPMEKVQDGWNCEIQPKGNRLNFCFHDGANHWDNNYGRNWSISIHDGGIL